MFSDTATFAKVAATGTPGPFSFFISTLSYTKENKFSQFKQASVVDLLQVEHSFNARETQMKTQETFV